MCEKKPDEPLRSAKKTTALWTVTADKDSGIPVTFDVQRPEPYCKRPIPQIFRVGKKDYAPEEIEAFREQLSGYYYEVKELSVEVNDDWGVETVGSTYTSEEKVVVEDAIICDGKLIGLFIDGHDCPFNSPFNSCYGVSLINGASVWFQGRYHAQYNAAGYVSSIWSDHTEYIVTLKLRDNG